MTYAKSPKLFDTFLTNSYPSVREKDASLADGH
jgi:hypothetical protein